MMKKCIIVEGAPPAVGPYSHAVKVGQFLFVSGQGPFNRDGSGVVNGTFAEQVEYTMENLGIILKRCGCDFSDVIKVTVFLKDMSLFPEFNQIYKKYFEDNFPARSCVGVSQLPADISVAIEAIAICKE